MSKLFTPSPWALAKAADYLCGDNFPSGVEVHVERLAKLLDEVRGPSVVFQPFVSGPALGGWHGKFYSKKIYRTRSEAEAALPEFSARCCDPTPFNALDKIEQSAIVELDLVRS